MPTVTKPKPDLVEPVDQAAARTQLEREREEQAAGDLINTIGERESEPQSAAGRQAAGLPAVEQPAVRSVVVPAEVGSEQLSADEMAMLRAYRASRGDEIRQGIMGAPQQVGTDMDPYTLVHQRGCPMPSRTEIYDLPDSNTGQMYTVHRCIECGAHQAIPH